MRYRAPLLNSDQTLPSEHLQCLSDAQLRRFAMLSLELNKPVLELMAGLMVEENPHHKDHKNAVNIEGILPNCGLYGCITPDGSLNT